VEFLAEPEISGPGLYFGLLHAHTTISDGAESPEEAFRYAAQVEGLDFFAVTDHSDYFDNYTQGQIGTDGSAVSADWAAGKAAAAAVTGADFVGIYGYEMSWPYQFQIGHIGTFATPGFQSWLQPPYNTYDGALQRYYSALASVPGAIGQFNHPGTQHGTFQEFEHRTPEADRGMALLEVGSGNLDSYRYYIRALDQGWHVAPTSNQASYSGGWAEDAPRTVVYAQSLTEEGIYEALRHRRAYATEDTDLEILYYMDGHFMGSQIDLADMGEAAQISVTVTDPTDAAVGTVEVITTGGTVLTGQALSAPSGALAFDLSPEPGYYFLRITQPDGDTAVTAPIWIDGEEDLGITDLVCETAVPVQNEPVTLTMELKNGENTDFSIDLLEILADGVPVAGDLTLTVIPANSTLTHSLTFSCDCVGMTEITLRLTGTLKGEPRTCEASVDISFHQARQVTAIAVDAAHGNAGLDQLTQLKQMAADEHIDLTVLSGDISAETLEDFRFLLVSAPSQPFSEEFLAAAAEFAENGGSLVLCGQADSMDSGIHSAGELNRLLEAVGSSLRMEDDLVLDTVNNTGDPQTQYTDRIHYDTPWCAGVSEDQVYLHSPGCSVIPGSGTWLINGLSTAICTDGDGDGLGGTQPADVTLLAAEDLSGGGSVFAAGCLFCCDSSIEEPSNIWAVPNANRTIVQNLLGIGGEAVPLSTVRQARVGADNELFRVRGYVTAGTSNPYNTFPDTLYLQDDTGGIAVMPFSETGIQQGTALEVTGYAMEQNGNRALKLSSWKVLDADMYLYEPLEGDWSELLDADLCGGMLVQAEGTCQEVYCREDGTLAGCLLQDENNHLAQVKVEDYIFAGSDGMNDLHRSIRKGRTVRAMGIVHIDEYGDTVIRVRNCEEVVWVPSPSYINPQTGDDPLFPAAMAISLGALILLGKRKRT